MNFETIAILIIAHWIGDFIFQKEEWATQKHNSFSYLLSHTINYALVIFIVISIYHFTLYGNNIEMIKLVIFWFFTLLTHTMVDYVTSKFTFKYSKREQYYITSKGLGFFPTIGLDQVIHYLLLFYSYQFLFL